MEEPYFQRMKRTRNSKMMKDGKIIQTNPNAEPMILLENISTVILLFSLVFGAILIILGLGSDILYSLFGIFMIFAGVVVYALLGVLNSIARNLIEIRKNTENK